MNFGQPVESLPVANFRCERVLVILDEPIPGLNHLNAVNATALASLLSEDLTFWMVEAGLIPFADFLFAPFDRPRWRPAGKGLQSVQGTMALIEQWIKVGKNPLGRSLGSLQEDLEVLQQVADVLDMADARDRRFYFAARDLE
jgi:hypothetical protein